MRLGKVFIRHGDLPEDTAAFIERVYKDRRRADYELVSFTTHGASRMIDDVRKQIEHFSDLLRADPFRTAREHRHGRRITDRKTRGDAGEGRMRDQRYQTKDVTRRSASRLIGEACSLCESPHEKEADSPT